MIVNTIKQHNYKKIGGKELLFTGILLLIILTCWFFIIIPQRPEKTANNLLYITKDDPAKTILYRDTWGVPHIYAPSVENGLFAMGWAQAQDRPDELLLNMLMGMGELSSVKGPDALNSDKIALLWNLYEGTKSMSDSINPVVLRHVKFFVAGINEYYKTYPSDIPLWWGNRSVDEFMVIAFSRMFLQSYSFDDGIRDIKRAGINPVIEPLSRFSNQFAIAQERTEKKTPILVSDLHLPWDGPYHFWEFRIHADSLNGSGFTLPGIPYIISGHNEYVAWSMTTGGPDCADAYKLTLQNNNIFSQKYIYNNEWKTLALREYTIKVKGTIDAKFKVYDSHFGPVCALPGNCAYAVKSSYAFAVNVLSPLYEFAFSKDINGIKKALSLLQLFPHNSMSADNSGNTYYQRSGRVPKRPAGFDFSRPLDGSSPECEWLGLSSSNELLQVLNPPQGYMQNCNVPPDAIMINSPLLLSSASPYLFADATQSQVLGYDRLDGWINSRGARLLELLKSDSSVTVSDAMAFANDIQPFNARYWVKALLKANASFKEQFQSQSYYISCINELQSWNFQLAATSRAALIYAFWRFQLNQDLSRPKSVNLALKIDCNTETLGKTLNNKELNNDELLSLLNSFNKAILKIKADFTSENVTYGDVFRIGIGNKSWPCEGNMAEFTGLTTVRSVGYAASDNDQKRWAKSGQTSTSVTVLSKPIQSWTCVPFGQCSNSESPHYSDQAEKLFSHRQMKPSWWLFKDLSGHIESTTIINIPK